MSVLIETLNTEDSDKRWVFVISLRSSRGCCSHQTGRSSSITLWTLLTWCLWFPSTSLCSLTWLWDPSPSWATWDDSYRSVLWMWTACCSGKFVICHNRSVKAVIVCIYGDSVWYAVLISSVPSKSTLLILHAPSVEVLLASNCNAETVLITADHVEWDHTSNNNQFLDHTHFILHTMKRNHKGSQCKSVCLLTGLNVTLKILL